MSMSNRFKSLLEVINYCDDFPLPKDIEAYNSRLTTLYHFKVTPYTTPLGYMLPHVARAFGALPGWVRNETRTPKTLTLSSGADSASRSAAIACTLSHLKAENKFEILAHRRAEQKPCYGPSGELLFTIERSAFPLLGIAAYGVMLLGYTRSPFPSSSSPSYPSPPSSSSSSSSSSPSTPGHIAGLWVQRRSAKVNSHVGLYDSTVAGGIPASTTPLAALLAEASEEASLSGELVGSTARACGTISYFHTRKAEMGGEVGLLQPGVQFLYEMEVAADVVPRGGDGTVAGFELLSLEEVRGAMLAGRVKPWFALAVVDFFVRHGVVTEENEEDFVEICMRLHRNLEFPVFGVSFLKD
ncbi:thiamine pyrophosphokinase-related protein-like protein [Hypoxylon argillaceum]|nr:thiamine pyrophosphokinase-related protein-like protein [Hypoxylon argillaceum]